MLPLRLAVLSVWLGVSIGTIAAAGEPRYAEIVSERAALMDGPREVGAADRGTAVRIVQEQGDWVLVELETSGGTRQFWTRASHLSAGGDQAALEDAWLKEQLFSQSDGWSKHQVALQGPDQEGAPPDYAEGLRIARELYELRCRRTGAESAASFAARYAVATLLFARDRFPQALEEYAELLAAGVRSYGPRDPRCILVLRRLQEVALALQTVPLGDYVSWLLVQTAYEDGPIRGDDLFSLLARDHENDLNWLDPYNETVPLHFDPVQMEQWRSIVRGKLEDPKGWRSFHFPAIDRYSPAELRQIAETLASVPRADETALRFAVGHLLLRLGLVAKADEVCRGALEGGMGGRGAESLDAAEAMFLMAGYRLRRGLPEEALELFQQADEIARRAGLPPHQRTAILDGMGQSLLKAGRAGEAATVLREAVKQAGGLGPLHPLSIAVHRDLALALAGEGGGGAWGPEMEKVVRLSRPHAFMTYEPRRLELFDPRRNGALYLAASRPEMAAQSAEWSVNLKWGRLKRLASDVVLRQLRRTGTFESVQNAGVDLQGWLNWPDEWLVRSLYLAPDSMRRVASDTDIRSAKHRWRAYLEARKIDFAPLEPRTPWIELAEIRKRIPPRTCVVEIHCCQTPDVGRTPAAPIYAAWIVPPIGTGRVQAVPLGAKAEIDLLVDQFLSGCRSPIDSQAAAGRRRFPRAAAGLMERLARPILAALPQGTARIWMAPDDTLWNLPFAALRLPDDPSRYLVERYTIDYLFGAATLLEKVPSVPAGPPLVVAAPEVDADIVRIKCVALEKEGRPLQTRFDERYLSWKATATGLPGTRQEASAVAPLLQAITGKPPRVLTGVEASESLVTAHPNPEYAVIAAHGFAFTRETPDTPAAVASSRLLHRCGLLLAGFNTRVRSGEAAAQQRREWDFVGLKIREAAARERKSEIRHVRNWKQVVSSATAARAEAQSLSDSVLAAWRQRVEHLERQVQSDGFRLHGCMQGIYGENSDGVLSAAEILTRWDLRGTRLVVLSACDSALGVVTTSGELDSLRLVFHANGARAVVATLWEIDDGSTPGFMQRFFAEIARGHTPSEALRAAQLAEIARERSGQASEPFRWAGFSLSTTGNPMDH